LKLTLRESLLGVDMRSFILNADILPWSRFVGVC
jgi:hypothetical protein